MRRLEQCEHAVRGERCARRLGRVGGAGERAAERAPEGRVLQRRGELCELCARGVVLARRAAPPRGRRAALLTWLGLGLGLGIGLGLGLGLALA